MNDLERLRKLAGLPGSQFNSDMNEADGVDEDHLNPDMRRLKQHGKYLDKHLRCLMLRLIILSRYMIAQQQWGFLL